MSDIYLEEINHLKHYIEQHYMEQLSLIKMAKVAYMNPYYFSAFFKKAIGKNFKCYLTEIRMKEAKKLVLNTDMRTYEIAEHVGYNNVRLFSDKFLEIYGKRPMEMKRIAKERIEECEEIYEAVM